MGEQFNKVRQVYNVNVLTQAAATFMLERLDVLEEQAARIRIERDAGQGLKSAAGRRGFSVGSQFSHPRAGRRQDSRRSAPGRAGAQPEQSRAQNCLRVTVGTPEENRILERLARGAAMRTAEVTRNTKERRSGSRSTWTARA